jgi:hypothetical protein
VRDRTFVLRCQNCLWVYGRLVNLKNKLPSGYMDKHWPETRCVSCGRLTRHVAEIAWQDGLPMVIWDEHRFEYGGLDGAEESGLHEGRV